LYLYLSYNILKTILFLDERNHRRSGRIFSNTNRVSTSSSSSSSSPTPSSSSFGISEGYGEATKGSMSKLITIMETQDKDIALNSQSTFLDIGSGFGKVVFHIKMQVGVRESTGIEYPYLCFVFFYFLFFL